MDPLVGVPCVSPATPRATALLQNGGGGRHFGVLGALFALPVTFSAFWRPIPRSPSSENKITPPATRPLPFGGQCERGGPGPDASLPPWSHIHRRIAQYCTAASTGTCAFLGFAFNSSTTQSRHADG